MDRAEHWNRIFETRPNDALSWFESEPDASLAMLDAAGVSKDACILDVGGGESRLIDRLLDRGFTCLTVLDVSKAGLERARRRLGAARAAVPRWIAADVTGEWSVQPLDVWHDRAAFHFLVDAAERAKYKAHLKDALKIGGVVIIATFALDGPETCSGLPVARYSSDTLAAELGLAFRLEEARPTVHPTPWGVAQSFQYSRFTRVA